MRTSRTGRDREQSAQFPCVGAVSKCLASRAPSCSGASSGIQWLTPLSTSYAYRPATKRGVRAGPFRPDRCVALSLTPAGEALADAAVDVAAAMDGDADMYVDAEPGHPLPRQGTVAR